MKWDKRLPSRQRTVDPGRTVSAFTNTSTEDKDKASMHFILTDFFLMYKKSRRSMWDAYQLCGDEGSHPSILSNKRFVKGFPALSPRSGNRFHHNLTSPSFPARTSSSVGIITLFFIICWNHNAFVPTFKVLLASIDFDVITLAWERWRRRPKLVYSQMFWAPILIRKFRQVGYIT